MKRLVILLMIISITAAVVLFPNVYYLKKDEKISSYHKQDTYNLNRVDNIDMQKKLEVLTDENSVYIDKTTELTEEDGLIITDIISQIAGMLYIDVDAEQTAIKSGMKSIQVINSSSYNVYSIDLKLINANTDKCDFTILFDANEDIVLYAEVMYVQEEQEYDVEEEKEENPEMLENIKNYYGDFTDWNMECFEYGDIFHIGSQQEINYILRKLELQAEEVYQGEYRNIQYNVN